MPSLLPTLTVSDTCKVFARWLDVNSLSYASNAKFTVHHAGGTTIVSQDQRTTGGSWRFLGTYTMAPGQGHKVVLSDIANNVVIADAVAFRKRNWGRSTISRCNFITMAGRPRS